MAICRSLLRCTKTLCRDSWKQGRVCSWRWCISSSFVSFTAPVKKRGAIIGWGRWQSPDDYKLGQVADTQFLECGNYMCVENKLFRDSVSCKNCRRTSIPKASWESANDMLKGDMMTFGCSGVVSRFCSSCTPSFWMAAAMASLDCGLRPIDRQPSTSSSSDEPPLGVLAMVVAITGASVVSAVSGCAVLRLSTF